MIAWIDGSLSATHADWWSDGWPHAEHVIKKKPNVSPVISGKLLQRRNSACRCGSGKKFKNCCLHK